jgi:hypothetical protein
MVPATTIPFVCSMDTKAPETPFPPLVTVPETMPSACKAAVWPYVDRA